MKSLQETILFHGVGAVETESILCAATSVEIAAGQFVYRQGDDCRCFFLVVSGEVELSITYQDNKQTIVGRIGHGGHFGETSLLTGRRNGVNARAITAVTLLSFDAEQFNSLLVANPAILKQLSVTLAERLRVSFSDHVNAHHDAPLPMANSTKLLDATFLGPSADAAAAPYPAGRRGIRSVESTIAKQINRAISLFGSNVEPLLIVGEAGTGRRMVASEVHKAGIFQEGPYTEVDVRNFEPGQLDSELLGNERDAGPFSQVAGLGLFERIQGGTVVLYNAECLEPDIQRQLCRVVTAKSFQRVGGEYQVPLRARIIFICRDDSGQENGHTRLLPALYRIIKSNQFRVAPLRKHRRDIPRLVEFYLKRFNQQYGKIIPRVDDQTLAIFMNYDWPGNLAEMSSVLQRAVILGKNGIPLSHQTMVGMPKPEGKWEFNLLRLRPVKRLFTSSFFPVVPRLIVGVFFLVVLGFLFWGPSQGEKNIGLTMSWIVGWPLLIFAFFFLSRIWCSVCGLSVPGWLAQFVVKPTRPTPQFIRRHSGWIMALLCIILFWVEITWNAYDSPRLTAWIIFTVTMGALVSSVLFKRRMWCRYLCPLGAINALFSMPSILELRANTHMCVNRCSDYACYSGDESGGGCPMFRHPFLVDNNRDCILCGQCIKNCKLNSVHLNLRLAPQELWNQQSPRLEDSILVVSLAGIFYPFVVNQRHPDWLFRGSEFIGLPGSAGSLALMNSTVFFLCIGFYVCGYLGMSSIVARRTGKGWRETAAVLGYGMIPLVLGAFMAAHLEIFVDGFWRLPANFIELAGLNLHILPGRLMSRDATVLLQLITLLGALLASLYANHRILQRLTSGGTTQSGLLWLTGSLLCISTVIYCILL